MLSKCLILWIAYFAAISNAGTDTSWLKPCPPLDSKCILNSLDASVTHFAKGDTVFGMPPIEPLPIKDTEVAVGDFKLKFRKVKLHHLSKCKFETFERDHDKLKIKVTVSCPAGIKGEYNMNGSIYDNFVFGDGPFSIEGGSILATIKLNVKTVMKDGKTHYKITSFDYEYEPISTYKFKFDNLYNGDKERADIVAKVVDGSWKEMMVKFGAPIMKECMSTLADFTNKMFQILSTDQLEIA